MRLNTHIIIRILTVILLLTNVSGGGNQVYALSGSGTSSDPYLIGSKADWDSFVLELNSTTFDGKYIKLTADIDIGGNITPGRSFRGTFDGNGHTIKVDVSRAGKYIALFRSVTKATIKNLRVVGSIHNTATWSGNSGSDYDLNRFTAGLVGVCELGTVIQNCVISVTIISDITGDNNYENKGDGSHGGIVGYVTNATTSENRIKIENCLFNGKLLGPKTYSCAGFVGAGYSNSYNSQICEIRNCLFAPTEVTMLSDGSATFSRCHLYNNAVSYSYYTKAFGTVQGADQSGSSASNIVELLNGNQNPGVDGYSQPWEVNEGGNVAYLKTFNTSVDVTGWMSGTTAGTSSTNPTLNIFGGDGVTYEYKRSDLLDEYYSTTAPTTAGHYYVRATSPDGFKSRRDFYVYDSPTPITGLVYNGNSQKLANYTNTAGGDFCFNVNNSGNYVGNPVGTNAGTYTVGYVVVGRTGYNTIGSQDPWVPVGSLTVTIDSKPLANPTISLDPTTCTFDGTAKTPSVTVKDGGTTVSSDEYTVSYSKNINVGTATVTITDKSGGNYIVNGSTTFTITPKVVSSPTVEIPATTYTGSPLKPTVTVKDGSTVIDPSEYTVSYSKNVNVGDAPVVTITDKSGGNYTVNGTGTFQIVKAAPTYTAPAAKELTYNMNKQGLVTVGSTNHGTLYYSSDGVNFEISPEAANLYGTEAKVYPTYYKLIGDSNHSDIGNGTDQAAVYLPVTIKAKPVSSPEIIVSPNVYNYDGTAKQPAVTVRDGGTVIPTSEYTVEYQDNVNAGSAKVVIKDNPNGNYNVSGTAQFSIIAQQPGVTPPTPISGLIYNAKQQNLIMVGTAVGGTMEYSLDGTNFSTAIPKGQDAKQYAVYYRVKGDDNHEDREAVTIYATISPKTVSAPTISLSSSSLVYDGSAKEPSVTVKDGQNVIPASEYTVEYSNNVNVGTGMVIVMDKNGGNYIVNGSTTFQIISADAGITPPTPKTDLVYTGKAQVLINEGSAKGGTMEYSLDRNTYTTEAPTGTDAKEYKVYYRVKGDANHGDETATSLSVIISPKTLSQAEIILQPANYVYDGTEKQPAVTVMDGELKVPASEYTVKYSDNQKVGTGTVTLVDKDGGNYIVSGTANFAIISAVPGVTLPTAKTELVYNGSAQELITAGNAVGGTMEYSLDNKNYSTKVPTGTDAKQYNVYFRVIGNDGHDGMDPVSMIVKIGAKTVSNPSMELSPATNVYTGKALTPTVTLKDGDTGAVIPASEYTVSYSNNINIGTANIAIKDNPGGNYTVSLTTTFIINDPNIGFQAPKPISGMVYNGKAQNLVIAGMATEGVLQYSLDGKTYSTAIPEGTNAATYTVWYRVLDPTGNVKKGPETFSVTISPKSVLISVTFTGLSTQSIPALTVVDEQDNALLKDDYIVTYKDSQGMEVTPTNGQLPEGDYAIIVRPTGNYSGPSISTTFHVRGALSFVFTIQSDLVTVCLPYGRAVPDDYEVYYFDRVEDDGTPLFKRILLKQLKAGEPYILHYVGTSAGTRASRQLDLSPSNPALVDLSTPIAQMMIGGYVFTGIYDDMTNQKGVVEGAYILQADNTWQATASSKQADASKVYLEAFHAYLRHRDRSTDSPTINVKMSPSTTAINGIILEDEDGEQMWYDLNGRRIDHPQKGVNILRTSTGKTRKVVIR